MGDRGRHQGEQPGEGGRLSVAQEVAAGPGMASSGAEGDLPLDARGLRQGYQIHWSARSSRPTAIFQCLFKGRGRLGQGVVRRTVHERAFFLRMLTGWGRVGKGAVDAIVQWLLKCCGRVINRIVTRIIEATPVLFLVCHPHQGNAARTCCGLPAPRSPLRAPWRGNTRNEKTGFRGFEGQTHSQLLGSLSLGVFALSTSVKMIPCRSFNPSKPREAHMSWRAMPMAPVLLRRSTRGLVALRERTHSRHRLDRSLL